MSRRTPRAFPIRSLAVASGLTLAAVAAAPVDARAQSVEDGSDAAIGPRDARAVLDLIAHHLRRPDARVTVLRRSAGSVICGSVNVKNRDGLYIGERGFVADLATAYFGRIPEGPELLSALPAEDRAAMEHARGLYFAMCLD